MRAPIGISHEKQLYQVIFRTRDGVRNLNYYCDAETPQDARELAKNYLAADTLRPEIEVGDLRTWQVVEVNLL